jgi:hypothetical protein
VATARAERGVVYAMDMGGSSVGRNFLFSSYSLPIV